MGVCQCINSVLGTEKERPIFEATWLTFLNLAWSSWTLCLWEVETEVSARSSTNETVLAVKVPL